MASQFGGVDIVLLGASILMYVHLSFFDTFNNKITDLIESIIIMYA